MKSLFLLFILLLGVSPVECYIDPGTGSYLLQLFAAGLVGGLYGVKIYWSAIKSYFTKKSK